MTNLLSASLASIHAALQRLNRRLLLESLQTGLASEVVRSRLDAIGLSSTQELDELYGWRNGTSTSGVQAVDDIHIFPGFYFLSLEDAITNYLAFKSDSRWTAGWLPLFANGGGDFYVLDQSSSASGNPIRHFRIDEMQHPVEFDSLQALFTTLAAALARGIFFVDPSGYLEMDDIRFSELAKELNPDVAWWRD